MRGFITKRVPKKYGDFQDWFACIDYYMTLYNCQWSWNESQLTLVTTKGDYIEEPMGSGYSRPKVSYIIPFEGHVNGEWNLPKAGELLIESIKTNKLKKLTKKQLKALNIQ